MNPVTEEIQNALEVLAIPSDKFRLLSDVEGKIVFNDLLESFVAGGDRTWWWEAFSRPDYSIEFPDGQGFLRIDSIVPCSTEPVWFVVEGNYLSFYPVYEAHPSDIQKVIGECYGFEYYIVPKAKDWLLCENHHNLLIGVGDVVIQRMKEYSVQQSHALQ